VQFKWYGHIGPDRASKVVGSWPMDHV